MAISNADSTSEINLNTSFNVGEILSKVEWVYWISSILVYKIVLSSDPGASLNHNARESWLNGLVWVG